MNFFNKVISLLSLISETNILILTHLLAETGHLPECKNIVDRLTNRHKEIME